MFKSLRAWKSSPPGEHKDYLFIYIAAILWVLSYFIFLPLSTVQFVDRWYFILWLAPVLVGGILALQGLLANDNLLTERLGVTLMSLGPAVFGLLQLGYTISNIITTPEGTDVTGRVALVFLALWLFLFLNKRRRSLKRGVRIARMVPLPDEDDEGDLLNTSNKGV